MGANDRRYKRRRRSTDLTWYLGVAAAVLVVCGGALLFAYRDKLLARDNPVPTRTTTVSGPVFSSVPTGSPPTYAPPTFPGQPPPTISIPTPTSIVIPRVSIP